MLLTACIARNASSDLKYVTYALALGPCWSHARNKSPLECERVLTSRGWNTYADLVLVARVRGAVVYHDLVDLAELAEVLGLPQDVRVGEPRREPDDEDEVLLDDSDVGEVLAVLRDPLLLRHVLLPLLRLDLGQVLDGERLEVGRVLLVRGAARRAVARALRPDLVPAEAAYLGKTAVTSKIREREVTKQHAYGAKVFLRVQESKIL